MKSRGEYDLGSDGVPTLDSSDKEVGYENDQRYATFMPGGFRISGPLGGGVSKWPGRQFRTVEDAIAWATPRYATVQRVKNQEDKWRWILHVTIKGDK